MDSWVFPPDILIEILVRLPIESLSRMRCVSKAWDSCIGSPLFTAAYNNFLQDRLSALICMTDNHHRDQSNKSATLIDGRVYEMHKLTTLKLPFTCSFYNVVGSVQGLVCFHVPKSGQLFLWDPQSQRSKLLPNPKPRRVEIKTTRKIKIIMMRLLKLGRNKHRSIKKDIQDVFGMGYSLEDQDHKIVKITYVDNSIPNEIEVYSLRTDSWKRVKCAVPGITLPGAGVFSNGRIYWTATDTRPRDLKGCLIKIMWFDVDEEVAGETEAPDQVPFGYSYLMDWEWPRLTVVDGKLLYVMITDQDGWNTWEMDSWGEWSKKRWVPFHNFGDFVDCNWRPQRRAVITGNWVVIYDTEDGHKLFGYQQFLLCDVVTGAYKEFMILDAAHGYFVSVSRSLVRVI